MGRIKLSRGTELTFDARRCRESSQARRRVVSRSSSPNSSCPLTLPSHTVSACSVDPKRGFSSPNAIPKHGSFPRLAASFLPRLRNRADYSKKEETAARQSKLIACSFLVRIRYRFGTVLTVFASSCAKVAQGLSSGSKFCADRLTRKKI